jgi:hypothetical protein
MPLPSLSGEYIKTSTSLKFFDSLERAIGRETCEAVYRKGSVVVHR